MQMNKISNRVGRRATGKEWLRLPLGERFVPLHGRSLTVALEPVGRPRTHTEGSVFALRRSARCNPRCYHIGIGLDEAELIATGRGELIEVYGDSCNRSGLFHSAIRSDDIRGGKVNIRRNLPVYAFGKDAVHMAATVID